MNKLIRYILNFIKEYYQIFIIVIGVGVFYLYGNLRHKSLNNHIAYTKGKIFRIGPCARIAKCVEYEYHVNGIKYQSSESITNEKIKLDSCFYKEWTIAYDSTYPEQSRIIGFRIGQKDTVKYLIK